MTSWAQQIQTLPQPLKTWLHKSYLTSPNNTLSILFVDQETYTLVHNNFYYLSKIYPLVKEVYADTTSLFVLPSNDLLTYIKDGDLSFSHFIKEA